MPQSRSKFENYQWSSLSQQLSFKMPEYKQYAGSDPETSLQIANMQVFLKHGILKPTPKVKLVMDLLNEQRKALFATSKDVNEITKMGLQMPKKDIEYGEED